MNFKDLRYIVAIRNHRHFSKAADECCVSQPTLSMQLKKLEETLGVKLFERSNKEVHITAAGEKIAEKAREALQKEEDIKRIAQHFQNPYAGEFIFGAFPTLAPFLFPKIAPKISKKFPDMTLFLKEEVSERLVHSVRNGKIDFALSAQPVEDKKIQQHNLFFEPFYVAVSTSNSLSKEKEIPVERLKDEKLLLLEDEHCLSTQALEACLWDETFDNVGFRATSIETLRQMVVADLGITLMPETALRMEFSDIKYIPLKDCQAGRTISMIWRKSSPFQTVFEEVADIISTL